MELDLLRSKVIKLNQMWIDGEIPRLEVHEVYPEFASNDSRQIVYFTLPMSLNFQRNSPALWQSAYQAYMDPDTRYLFIPSEVIKLPREKIQQDLMKYRLALQKNKHTDIWIKLSETFSQYNDDPKDFLALYDFDVAKIVEAVQGEYKKSFPYLSGSKLVNYWLFILHTFTDIKFRRLDKISIIPDTHVLQASVELGITDRIERPEVVAKLWETVLEGTGILPIDMHPILWNWSRARFTPKIH